MRAATLVALILLAGCVERRLLVRTDPPGAEVTVNGEKVGRSPTTWRFTHYGDALVEVEKPGYEPTRQVVALRAPWYQKPGVDFFSDVLVPARIKDDHEVEIRLEPAARLTEGEREREVAELTRAADKLRRQAEASR
ncbi:MAG TPA: PEGA domain-containing protein [Planctomycetota bacterium]|nr:PEGA domain-containing protein [Planctomycetota bacterium]